MVQTTKIFTLETECRRRGWSRGGVAVMLGDGHPWHLPAVTDRLLASMPELREELRGILDLAAPCPETATERIDGLSTCYGHMAVIARRLLRENYDLPGCTWDALLDFGDLISMFGLMMSVSYAFDTSRDEWRPWLEAT